MNLENDIIIKANRLEDIYKTFRSSPLAKKSLDTFYYNVDSARSKVVARDRIERTLKQIDGDLDKHILFIGYKGCGKSTELNQLQKSIHDEFLILTFSVLEELDIAHINYIELFIVAMEKLFKVAEEQNMKISKRYLESIKDWVNTTEVKEIREKYLGGELEAGIEAKVNVPYLLKFFGKFKSSAKSSKSL
ncbi:MAG: hypothetical protein AAGI07_08100, partial [Bacteroidota bacterium]